MGQLKKFVKVAVIFKAGKITPVWFEWNNNKYLIDKITYRWEERKGRSQILYFAVISNGELYQLQLDTENFVWDIKHEITAKEDFV